MAEDIIIEKCDALPDEEPDNFLFSVINHQIDILYSLEPLNYQPLYDKAKEDKIKCVGNCFEIIAAAQKALLKEIKTL